MFGALHYSMRNRMSYAVQLHFHFVYQYHIFVVAQLQGRTVLEPLRMDAYSPYNSGLIFSCLDV